MTSDPARCGNKMIAFRVLGVPAPQGSKTRMPNGAMLEGGAAELGVYNRHQHGRNFTAS